MKSITHRRIILTSYMHRPHIYSILSALIHHTLRVMVVVIQRTTAAEKATYFLSQERHVVVHLLRRGQMSQSGQQRAPDAPAAPAAVLLPLHVVLCSVEGKHAELGEEALQDGPLPGNGPQLLHLHGSQIAPRVEKGRANC